MIDSEEEEEENNGGEKGKYGDGDGEDDETEEYEIEEQAQPAKHPEPVSIFLIFFLEHSQTFPHIFKHKIHVHVFFVSGVSGSEGATGNLPQG